MEPTKPQTLRCAIYTRKSSEEGLEQDFNSLHAQRESCESFIRSQQGEGWRLIKTHYDDGGLSGGTMERPALQSLLEDIRQKLVDVVVVYKVDRLTRSLSDFACQAKSPICRQSARQFRYGGDRPPGSTPARERKENAGRSGCSCRRRTIRNVGGLASRPLTTYARVRASS